MSNCLALISELEKLLRTDATFEETGKWWNLVLSIETQLQCYDRRTTKEEKEAITRLKDGVTKAISAIRDRLPSPSVSPAKIALSTLRYNIEKRTIGSDGWPMRT